MGATFYIIGFLIAAALFGVALGIYLKRNEDRIANFLIDQACYIKAKERGYIKPGECEDDRRALDYAIKYNKKVTWKVID